MSFTWITHVSTNNSYCMCNIRFGENHNIHQRTNSWGIGILFMFSISWSDLGDWSLLSLKWLSKGVLTCLALSILNLLKTFFTYFDCESFQVPLALSLVILIPRIYFALPKSFISNCFDNPFQIFNLLNAWPCNEHTSTYNNKMIYELSKYLK